MSNFIRACFCINDIVPDTAFDDLFKTLDLLDCKLSTEQNPFIKGVELDSNSNLANLEQVVDWLSNPGYLNISLVLTQNNKPYETRIVQRWQGNTEPRFLSFDLEDTVFLPEATIEFTPNNDVSFEKLKQILIGLVRYLKPFFGAIDYEADLECGPLKQYKSIVSWGNYFSSSILNKWPQNELEELLQIPNESLKIDDLGLLTFIHPLTVNQAWTNRHEEMQFLINRNMLVDDRG